MALETTSVQKSKILVVEDHAIFRMGLVELINLEDDLLVCGEAESIQEAKEQLEIHQPDMIVVDISLHEENGLDLVRDVHQVDPQLPMLLLTMHEESLYAEMAFQAGAKGYIMKREATKSVVNAIRSVLQGNVYMSQKFLGTMLNKVTGNVPPQEKSPMDSLTKREGEVFHLIGMGNSTKEIADELNISARTVGTYRERIKEKLQLKHATELVRHAIQWVTKNN